MREICIVKSKQKNNLYEIQILEEVAGCTACAHKDSCGNSGKILLAQSEKERKPGEKVVIEIEEKNEALRSLLVFFFPVLSGLMGSILSHSLVFPGQGLWAALAFCVFMAGTFIVLKKLEFYHPGLPELYDYTGEGKAHESM